MLFPLGRMFITLGAVSLGINFTPYILRHTTGDWGDVCEEDSQANDAAVTDGDRIFSSYQIDDDSKIWIITETGS